MEERRRIVTQSNIFYYFVFFFLIWFSSAEIIDSGVNYEVLALIDMKSSLIDPHEVLKNWDINSVDPCSWDLVTCSPDGWVVSLNGERRNLSGTLTTSIGNLTKLQTLLLQNNKISGHIPSEIDKLFKLKLLNLSKNNFTGQIPEGLSHLTSLQYLDLSYNNLSGPVPRLHAKAFNIMGNPKMCPAGTEKDCNGSQSSSNQRSLTSHGITRSFNLSFIISVCMVIIVFHF